jgi:hypothetical protein
MVIEMIGGFLLGSHVVNHLEKTDVPLFISYRQLRNRKKIIDQKAPLAIDSGGFSELRLFGEWTITPQQYVDDLNRLVRQGVKIEWCAQQDFMCEPFMLDKTGLSISDHQRLTVENFLELRSMDCSVHIIPVLQGWTLEDYFDHFEMFESAGVDLRSEPLVGVGSVCRREGTAEIEYLMKCLHAKGIRIHGFGVKTSGLKRYGQYLHSADSLAWSYGARMNKARCEIHQENYTAKNCANCIHYALEWREKVLKNSNWGIEPKLKIQLKN